jgi:hypothetical protein
MSHFGKLSDLRRNIPLHACIYLRYQHRHANNGNLNGKKFQWFSLGWAALFLLLNIFHLAGDGFAADDFDPSQVVLLSFVLVLVINVTLVITLWKTVRQGKS